jgi:hypothetical protein
MTLILSGTDGLSDVDGSAATPAIRGTDANTGIFFGADIIGFAEGGAEVARFNADAQFVAAAGTAALPVITTTGDTNTGIFFPAADTIAFSEGGVESMRIDSAGNVGIGTSSPQQKLHIYNGASGGTRTAGVNTIIMEGSIAVGLQFLSPNTTDQFIFFGDPQSSQAGRIVYEHASNAMAFNTNATERARIDSSGNLLVGTPAATGGRIVSEANSFNESGADNWKKGAFNGRGSFGGPLSFVNTGGDSDGFCFYLTGTPSQLNIRFGANAGALSAGVYMTSTATSWTAQSDERLKNITGTITDAVQSVKSLRPVRYTLKADQDKTHRVGLIAQDVQKVLPEVVDTDANGYLGVRYSELVPLLVSAIQEQQALITTLTDRITALEAPTGTQA